MSPVKVVGARFIQTLNRATRCPVSALPRPRPAIRSSPRALDGRTRAAAVPVLRPAAPGCPAPTANPAQRPRIGWPQRGFSGRTAPNPPNPAMFDLSKPNPMAGGAPVHRRANRGGRSGCGRTGGHFPAVRATERKAASVCEAHVRLNPGNCAISGARPYPEHKIHAKPLKAKQKRPRCGQPGSHKEKPRPHRGRGQNLERLRKD